MKEHKACRDVVEAEDGKMEIDWIQRPRQLWRKEGDANERFFHISANGRK